MQHFMDPKSVALIGISRKSGPGSFNLMEIMSDFGYSGEIYPVNPNAGEILGKKAYPSVTAVKKKIDLAGSYDAWRTQTLFGGLEGGFERLPCGWNYLRCHCHVARVFLSECLRGSERRG